MFSCRGRAVERTFALAPVEARKMSARIEDERRPTLRPLLVAGLVEHLRIEPTERTARGAAAAQPQGVVGVLGKNQMMRAEAGVDERELRGFRIEHAEVAPASFDRE